MTKREGLHFFLQELFYSDFFSTADVTSNSAECKYLSFTGVAAKPFATGTDHSWLGGSFWCIVTLPGVLFRAGSDIFAGKRGSRVCRRKQ